MPQKLVIEISQGSDESELNRELEQLRAFRDQGGARAVVSLGSIGTDLQDLANAPEATELCQQLVNCGMIAYLDFATVLNNGDAPEPTEWGAAEIWLCAHRRLEPWMTVSESLFQEIERAIEKSRAAVRE